MKRLNFLKRLSSGISIGTCMIFLSSFSAKSEDIVIWGGFPELQGYYERVADSIKDKHPNINVIIEPIGLRDHEKRVALALSSGLEKLLYLNL